jgi:pimeloyl-ACP methyl ester carboxylesterase
MRDGALHLARTLALAFTLVMAGAQFKLTLAYSGPPSSRTAYWEEPAFADLPYKGPADARGVLFWSHGLNGHNAQWHIVPPPIVRDFARAGWDVVKVQRNNLHENGWNASGPRHVDDLLERVAVARRNGYRQVILAGQSYGGAISLEAAGRDPAIFAVIAFAPGHGSDACGGHIGSREISANLPGYLLGAIERQHAARIVLSLADGDDCMGNQHPSAVIEAALDGAHRPYIHFDDRLPIRGHGAAETRQFSAWYRECLLGFLNPEKQPAAGPTSCPAPVNTRFLVPPEPATSSGAVRPSSSADFIGRWSGALQSLDTMQDWGREVCVDVDEIGTDGLAGTVYYGAGPARLLSMSALKLQAGPDGEAFTQHGQDRFALSLTPRLADATIDLAITSRNGRNRYFAKLKPGC